MIKFAVTRPKQRLESIQHGIGMLKWKDDHYLKYFGMEVDSNMTVVSVPSTFDFFWATTDIIKDQRSTSPEPRDCIPGSQGQPWNLRTLGSSWQEVSVS